MSMGDELGTRQLMGGKAASKLTLMGSQPPLGRPYHHHEKNTDLWGARLGTERDYYQNIVRGPRKKFPAKGGVGFPKGGMGHGWGEEGQERVFNSQGGRS